MEPRTVENMAVWNTVGLIAQNDTVTLSVEAFDRALILARLQVMHIPYQQEDEANG